MAEARRIEEMESAEIEKELAELNQLLEEKRPPLSLEIPEEEEEPIPVKAAMERIELPVRVLSSGELAASDEAVLHYGRPGERQLHLAVQKGMTKQNFRQVLTKFAKERGLEEPSEKKVTVQFDRYKEGRGKGLGKRPARRFPKILREIMGRTLY
jgi:hypothetical protein